MEFDTSVKINALFWLVYIPGYIASYVFKSPSICFQGTKYEINREDVVYLHSTLWRWALVWLELFASTVLASPHAYFFGDAVALLWDDYMFV